MKDEIQFIDGMPFLVAPLRNVFARMQEPQIPVPLDAFIELGIQCRRMAASSDDLKQILAKLNAQSADQPTPKPAQKNRYAFLDGITPKRRPFNQRFHNFKGR